ncbi:hypothetical protein JCM10212_006827 [Sporobolomyces blumeae]
MNRTDPTSEDSLSQLSAQLVSHGFLSRPLALAPLFAPPPAPSSSSKSSLERYNELVLQQARSKLQLVQCLWGLFERNTEDRERLVECVEREKRSEMEWERERGLRERARKEREQIARELESERAKVQEAEGKLKVEQERHRHARDELSKAKHALQFVKTQALHDQKRRETEVSTLHARLQKLTTDSSQTKFVVLNSASTVASGSAATTSSRYSPSTAPSANGRTTRRVVTPSASSPVTPGGRADELEGELALVQSSLADLEDLRSSLTGDNTTLRTFLSELDDWIDRLVELPEFDLEQKGMGSDDGEEGEVLVTSEGEESENKKRRQEEAEDWKKDRDEAREALRKIQSATSQADSSFSIPNPSLSLPPHLLLPPLHQKLYAVRLCLSVIGRSVSYRVERERRRGEKEVEWERREREEGEQEIERVRAELDEARALLQQSQQLVTDLTEYGVSGGRPRPSQLTGGDDSGDELPQDIKAELERRKLDKALHKKKKVATLDPSGPVGSGNVPSRSTATGSASTATAGLAPRPSIPSKSVSDFLGSLGLDTPQGVDEKAALVRPKPVGKESEKWKEAKREAGKDAQEGDGEFKKPSLPAPRPKTRKPSTSSTTATGGATKSSSRTENPSSTTSKPASAPQGTDPLLSRSHVDARDEGPSMALQSILSLAQSPPSDGGTLQSARSIPASLAPPSKAPAPSAPAARERASKEDGGAAANVKKTREELIREKKESLMRGLREGSGRAARGGAGAV